MRLRKAFLSICIMLMAISSLAALAPADFGVSPAWSPDWGTAPAITPLDGSGKADLVTDIPGTTSVSRPPDAGDSQVSIAVPPPTPIPAVFGTDSATTASETIGPLSVFSGAFPSMPLLELTNGNSMNTILIPDGGVVLPSGDISYGSAIGHQMPPMPPGYWDDAGSMDLHTNMPVL